VGRVITSGLRIVGYAAAGFEPPPLGTEIPTNLPLGACVRRVTVDTARLGE
jgi:hypothetical protein